MISILFVLFFGIALIGLGLLPVQFLDRDNALRQSERIFCAFLIGALMLSFAVQAVGHYRLDQTSMLLLAITLVASALPGLRRLDWKKLATQVAGLPRLPGGLVLLVALLSFLQGLAPPNDYDSLMYHLAVPKGDIERGYIAPNWMLSLSAIFFPHLIANTSRFALALLGETAAQPFAGLFGLAAIAGTALLAARVGLSTSASLWAGLMFAASRVVVWEMGTVEVDVPLATATCAATLVFIACRNRYRLRHMVLLGLLLGTGFNMKYQGGLVALAFAPLLLADLARKRASLLALCVLTLVSLFVFAPHLAENWRATGDPLFPLYFSKFVPGGVAFYDDYHLTYGIGRSLLDFLLSPWFLFVAPMRFFDGMVLGAPYFLALSPAAFIGWRRIKEGAALLTVVLAYFTLWFFVQSQQVRFLLPILPCLSVMAAAGGQFLWQATASSRFLRALMLLPCLVMFANEALFVAIYSALRLPVALGLQSAEEYHANTPTLNGAKFKICNYISANLKPGEHYLSVLIPHSYYCPQTTAVLWLFKDEERNWLMAEGRKRINFPEFVERLEALNLRFIAVTLISSNRRNQTGTAVEIPMDLSSYRFGPFITPALEGLQPVIADPYNAVFDAAPALRRMKQMLRDNNYPQSAR